MIVKVIFCLGLFVLAVVYLIPQDAYAISITATPQATHFGPNDWIKVDLSINGYLGGTVNWVAHRPDGSTISGKFDQLRYGKITHQISRNAFDNYFGTWSIDYTYNGITQIASFVVDPIVLSVTLDKELYYDGDTIKVIITTSYFVPTASKAEYYHLNFYDKKGNLANGIPEIKINAYQSSASYDFPINTLVQDNPLGKYKIKVQYYNVFVEVPFEIGDIEKRMTVFVGTDRSLYHVGDNVDLNLIFSKVRESQGVMEITDPSGNTTSSTFPVTSVLTRLHLEKGAVMPGTYRLEIHYAGITQEESFVVENPSSTKPNIVLELTFDKQYYRPSEIINAKMHTTNLIADSVTFWFEDPTGKQGLKLSIPITSGDTIIPHKINRNDPQGTWKMHINFGGATKFAIFFVEGEPVDETKISTIVVAAPKLLMTIDSGADIKFKNPRGIAVDSDDNIYVADSGNSQIKKFDSHGKFLISWGSSGTGNGQFISPSGIAVDSSDNVYVVDAGNNIIEIFFSQF